MPVLPQGKLDKLMWFEERISQWQANAVAIGLTPALATSMKGLITAGRAAYDAAQAARIAAKNATFTQDVAIGAMVDLGGDLIATIKSFAETTNNPAVYTLSSVPPPAPPSPPPPLTPPEDVLADPNADGTITLKWKGSLKFSTFYAIFRKGPGETTFSPLATVAAKSFIDVSPTPPTATARTVEYIVRAQRQAELGPPAPPAVVTYGAGGQMFSGIQLAA